MPQTQPVVESVNPTYSIVVIKHGAREEEETEIDRGTQEEARDFLTRVLSALPAILAAGALLGSAIHQLAHLHYLTQM